MNKEGNNFNNTNSRQVNKMNKLSESFIIGFITYCTFEGIKTLLPLQNNHDIINFLMYFTLYILLYLSISYLYSKYR